MLNGGHKKDIYRAHGKLAFGSSCHSKKSISITLVIIMLPAQGQWMGLTELQGKQQKILSLLET